MARLMGLTRNSAFMIPLVSPQRPIETPCQKFASGLEGWSAAAFSNASKFLFRLTK